MCDTIHVSSKFIVIHCNCYSTSPLKGKGSLAVVSGVQSYCMVQQLIQSWLKVILSVAVWTPLSSVFLCLTHICLAAGFLL